MNIISMGILKDYWDHNPGAKQHLLTWVAEVKQASWAQPADIKEKFRNASILKNRRVVFNIKGNDHRLVAAVAYMHQRLYIKFVGTHAEYDSIDAETVELKD